MADKAQEAVLGYFHLMAAIEDLALQKACAGSLYECQQAAAMLEGFTLGHRLALKELESTLDTVHKELQRRLNAENNRPGAAH